MVARNVGRAVETGTLLGLLIVTLAATGILLSPTVMTALGLRASIVDTSNALYVIHLVAAVLLVAFTVWHVIPWRRILRPSQEITRTQSLASTALLTIVAIATVTGIELWSHVYLPLPKATAVLVHLATTFLIVVPLAIHATRGVRIWHERRLARAVALSAADAVGRGAQAREAADGVSRRMFLRLAGYALAATALAVAFGSAARQQLQAWRVNSIGATPAITKEGYRLRVTGLVGKSIELTYAELVALPQRDLHFTHHCVEGWTYTDTFTGVPLKEVLALAGGVDPAARQFIFKSPETSRHYLTAGQQYTTNFPVEDGLHDDVLLVFKAHGEDLEPIHGFPVRLMTPRKWGYKACKWLTEIEVSSSTTYRGYWERNGYHNDGDYPGPIFA